MAESEVDQWLRWDKNPETRERVLNLQTKGEEMQLIRLMRPRLKFGTAGIRGEMKPGFAGMNDLVIIQTSQGLVSYLESVFGQRAIQERGVVIGFDARYNSSHWAQLTALACLEKGVRVYLFSRIVPTPFVPYTVTLKRAVCGVMVTASHNPKQDNGYKVYWENGPQIISPHDKGIQMSIEQNLEPWANAWDLKLFETNKSLVSDPIEEVLRSYYGQLEGGSLDLATNAASDMRITFTPMHGVGQEYMERAFEACQLKPPLRVPEQCDPDPEFSTVRFPNPEEGKSALNLAMKAADAGGSRLIIANDPDSDRTAVAEKEAGSWRVFTGNEIGSLLGWWMWHIQVLKRQQNPDKDWPPLEKCLMLASTVSSKFLRAMAKREGFQFEETLTGFKWMGNLAYDLQKQGAAYLIFAFEEAIGFLCSNLPLDKDGISGGVRVAELAIYLQREGLTLGQKLNELYCKYGFHTSLNGYFICHEPSRIDAMFHELRNHSDGGWKKEAAAVGASYPLFCGDHRVTYVRDLTLGFDSSHSNGIPKLPVSKTSHMITFRFDNGCEATIRTSGTEPKVKYYTELCATPDKKDQELLKAELATFVTTLIQEFMQPDKFKFEVPKLD
ncbi:unnamed protein product [Cyprideis torosa]|uniref:Uncharacterized protein n=1 Tax=Cyprideis torosa TaxID=163714 RepID=A0A7R8ZG30_9CRUS|nr:unnamed protein product [Cyprideis torosa]CAG0880611.1 unnamed protein product [Cyprideis torosa]